MRPLIAQLGPAQAEPVIHRYPWSNKPVFDTRWMPRNFSRDADGRPHTRSRHHPPKAVATEAQRAA